jgi:hypothetical protein
VNKDLKFLPKNGHDDVQQKAGEIGQNDRLEILNSNWKTIAKFILDKEIIKFMNLMCKFACSDWNNWLSNKNDEKF